MYLNERYSFEEAKNKIFNFKSIGIDNIYLEKGEMPWALATNFETGGTHRIDIPTCGYFSFALDGIIFKWNFELEDRDANGKGYYEINKDKIKEILTLIRGNALLEFQKYLSDCITQIQRKGQEWQEIADRQFSDAAVLRGLIAQ